jgi:hypothetical protein
VGALSACGGSGHQIAAPTNVPAALEVPGAPSTPRLHALGRGVQIYVCTANPDGSYAWVFSAPDATLFDDQQRSIGKHYAGPSWELDDGSKIVATVMQKVAAPQPADDIPWLLLAVTAQSGAGELAGVRYVQRLDTAGGNAPADGCDAAYAGQQARVTYSADYYFW